jgi:hypothetical protein
MPAVLLAALLLCFTALYVWGIWVARRQREWLYRLAARCVPVGVVFGMGGVSWALWRVARAEEAARAGDPSAAAAQLAAAISGTVALAAVPIALGSLILIACTVVFVLGTARRPVRSDEGHHSP